MKWATTPAGTVKLAAVLLPTLLAGPALAQDLVWSSDATQACLAAEEVPAAHCAGRSADACMEDTPGGTSTVGMGGCLDRERAWWDQRLNAAYGRAMAEAKKMDAANAGTPGAPSEADALREMQRAWIPYRDRKCDYVRAGWGGGTGGGPAMLSCLLQETAAQALWLERAEGRP